MQLVDFIYDRLAGSLREQATAPRRWTPLALRPQPPGPGAKQLAAVRASPRCPRPRPWRRLGNKRITNILKKAEAVDAHVNPELLQEQAEQDLYAAAALQPEADAQFAAGDYTASLQTPAVLQARRWDAFFDDVMVNAEQLDLRLNRQGLLKSLHDAMNRVADLFAWPPDGAWRRRRRRGTGQRGAWLLFAPLVAAWGACAGA